MRRRHAPRPSRRTWHRTPAWALTAVALAAGAQTAPPPGALPQGAQVQAGSATLQQTGALLTIQQTSDKLVTNWQRFDIGADATVRFLQPGRDSVALNRVLSQEPSALFGQLQANGQVFLLNPSGVLFGATARVDVGGLVASSLALADADFLAGRHRFHGTAASGAVHNAGRIQAAEGGYVAFLAPRVANSGQITVPQGDVVLAAGEGASLDFAGDRLLNFTLDRGTASALVDQQGLVQAEGGRVLLSARAADAALRAVVNQGGVVDAGSLVARGGRIVLEADEITLAPGSQTIARGATGGGQVLAGGGWGGSGGWRQAQAVTLAPGALVDASATTSGAGGEVVLWSDVGAAGSHTVVGGQILARGADGAGGRIETSGHRLDVSGTADAGPGGLWLLDPVDITITTTGNNVPPGGGTYGTAGNVQASSIVTALNNGNSVVLDTSGAGASQGDITVATDIVTGAMAADATLTLKANRNVIVNAGADIDATSSSSNTRKLNLVLWADQDGSGGGAIQLGATGATQTLIRTNGGGLWMGGGSGSSSWTPFAGAAALTVGNGAAIGTDASGTGWGLSLTATSIHTAGGHVQGHGRSQKNSSATDTARGVNLQGAEIITGAGNITMRGEVANTSGTTIADAFGTMLHADTLLQTTSGAVSLTGVIESSARFNRGVALWLGSTLGATAATGDVHVFTDSGAISLLGIGADAAGSGVRHGLDIRNEFAGDDTLVRSVSGNILLEGQANYLDSTTTGTSGLHLHNDTTSSQLHVVSQTGDITLRGSNSQEAGSRENALRFQPAAVAGQLRIGGDGSNPFSGDLLIEANSVMQFNEAAGAGAISLQGTGSFTLRPIGSSFTQLRSGDTNPLQFDNTWNFGSGWSSFTLGKVGNTAALTLANALTVAGSAQILGGQLALNAALTTAGDLLLQSTGDITQAAGVAVTTQGGSAIYRADSDGSGAGMVYLKDGASLTTAGGHIWMGGGAGTVSWNGLTVGDGLATGGTVIPKAELLATVGDDFKNGITLYNASLNSGGGDIALHGRSGSGSDVYGYMGVYLGYGASLRSGAGDITVQGQASGGTSSTSTGWHYGVLMLPTGNNGSSQGTTTIESGSGAVQITGTAQHDQAANHSAGLALFTQGAAATAQVLSTTGSITLDGRNLNASNPSYGGILATGSGRQQVVSQSGDISLSGSSANTAVVGLNLAAGTRIGSDGVTPYSGDITLTTDGLTLASTASLQSSGSLTLAPASAATTVGLGGASGVLSVPATAFSSSFVDGFSQISIGRADGSGAMSVGSLGTDDALTLRNGSGGISLAGTLVAGAALNLETDAGLSGSGNVQLGSGQTLTVTQTGDSVYAGVISGSGSLSKYGSGTLELAAANTYSGGSTVNAGRLFGGAGSEERTAFGSGPITVASGATLWLDRAIIDNTLVLAGGVLLGSNGFGEVVRGDVTLTADSSVDSSFNITWAGNITGSGRLTLANTWRDEGELRITGNATHTGGTVLDRGVLQIGTGGTSGSVSGAISTSATSSVVFSRSDAITHSGAITGAGTLQQQGSGTLTLGNHAAHTGATVIGSGSLVWASDTPVFGTSGFSGAGRLVVQPVGSSFSAPLDLGSLPTLAAELGGLLVGSASNTAAMTLASAVAITGDITLLGGPITLASGASLATSDGDITLSSSRFVNQAGALALSAGGSGRHWQVWSHNPDPFDAGTGDVRGGLLADYKQYGATYGSSAVLGTGKGLLYTLAPTLTATLGGVSKVYDGSPTATVDGSHFAASGAVDGDNIVLSTPSSATFTGAGGQNAGNGKAVSATGVALVGASRGSATVYGYSLASGTATGSDGEISPAALTLSGSRVYDGSTAMAGSTLLATGVNGETFDLTGSGASGNLAIKGVQTAQPLASVAGLALGSSSNGGLAGNYQALSVTGSSVSVTARPVIVTSITAADKVYDGGLGATIIGGAFSGRVNGDDLTLSSTGSFADKQVGTGKTVTLVNTFGGADLGNYSITDQTSTTASITAKTITLSGITAADKVYDGSATASVSGGSFSGLVNGDDLTFSSTGSFADKHAGNGKTVTLLNTFGGADLGNYSITDQTSTTASITAKTITLSGITAADKVYDGGLAAVVSGGSFSGLVNGDELTLSSTGSFADKHAGNGKTVTLLNTFGGADLGNYSITDQTTTTASITPKAIMLSGVTAADKVYDGGTVAVVSGGSFSGVVSGDEVTLSSTGSFADKHAGNGKTVTLVNTFGGADLGNYSITDQIATTASITPKAIMLSGVTAADKVYDGSATASVSGGGFSGLVNGDDLTFSSSGSFADKNVGIGKTVALVNTFGGADLGNYSITDQIATTASITPKAIMLSGVTAADKVYDGSATASVSGGGFSGLVNGDDLTFSSSGSFADKNVGIGKTVALVNTLGGADLGNYSITDQIATTASITPKAIMLSGVTAADKVYDGGTAAVVSGGSFSGVVSGDDLTFNSSGSFADKHAGNGKTVTLLNTFGGADLGNYSITDQTSTAASITAKSITLSGVTAADKVYDGGLAAAVSGGSFSGLVNGDELTLSSTGSFADKHAGNGKTVTLVNTFGGADLGNYSITDQTTTTASITAKAITLSGITAADKVYDGGLAAAVSGGSFSGVVSGDQVTFSASGSFTNKHVGIGKTVALVNTFGGADLGNYSVTGQASTTASITAKVITLSGITAADKFYDGSTTASVNGGTFSGQVTGDDLTFSSTGSFANKHVGTGKTVTLVNTLGGADLGNYSITDQTSATASITPKALTLSGITAANKVYDGGLGANIIGGIFGGLVNGDQVTLSSAGNFADKHVGVGKTVTLVNTFGGADRGNYSITDQTTTTASITAKTITLSGISAADKVYDGGTVAVVSGGSFSGVVNGDEVTFRSIGHFADKNAGVAKTVSLENTLGGADLGNYSVSMQTQAVASITPRPLTLVVTAQDKVYDGQTTAQVQLHDDRVAGDTLLLAADARFADRHVGAGKAVSVQLAPLGGGDAANYRVVGGDTLGSTASITQRASVTWIGAPGGDWMDASQWADGALPDFANVAQVLLPDGATPRLASGTVQLAGLLGPGATLALAGGALATGPATLGGLQQTGGSWRAAGDVSLGSPQAMLLLGDLQVAGALTLAATGGTVAMAGDAALQVTGAVQLQAASATLVADGALQLGTLALSGDLHVRSTGALDLGQGRVGGALDAASHGGDVTQAGALVVVAGTAIDAGSGAVRLPEAGNRFTGPVHIVGAGGVQVRGTTPDGLSAVGDAATAALSAGPAAPAAATLPPITVLNAIAPGDVGAVERLPLSLQAPTAAGPALDFELLWTGGELQLRPRNAAAAAMAESRRAELVALALRMAQARWGLSPARITAVYLLP